MALPVSPDPTDRRAAVLRMLHASPDGLSDAALAQTLGDGIRPQTVNQLCRRLVAEGALERVGTRPILNRLPTPPARRRGRKTTAASSAPDSTPEAPPTDLRARGTGSRRMGKTTPPSGRPAADVSTPTPDASKTEASSATDPAPAAIRRAQNGKRAKSGHAASDDTTPVPDASEIEASPATEPATATATTRRAGHGTRAKSGRTSVTTSTPDTSETEATPAAQQDPTTRTKNGRAAAEPQTTPPPAKPRRRKQTAAETAAPETDSAPASEEAGTAPDVTPTTSPSEPEAPTCGPPPFDALQAWSRVANVQALVADWLVRRGATLRSATLEGQGPTRDLVASLDGDDVHVEVTGWPADGARTHPTTIAGDWFSGAEQAAAQRRRAHPKARIVIALPDTRRYRSLTEQRATSLAGARAEVWFVDPAGSVQAR